MLEVDDRHDEWLDDVDDDDGQPEEFQEWNRRRGGSGGVDPSTPST